MTNESGVPRCFNQMPRSVRRSCINRCAWRDGYPVIEELVHFRPVVSEPGGFVPDTLIQSWTEVRRYSTFHIRCMGPQAVGPPHRAKGVAGNSKFTGQ
jgi:hypothetical protein